MKPMLPLRLAFSSVGLAILLPDASAQSTPASTAPSTAARGETVELSPFVITSDSDKGYVATSSLAGSRLRTNLKDIAAPVDVLTLEFLSDVAATNLDEAVLYSTNNGSANEQNTGPNDGAAGGKSTRTTGRARGLDETTQFSDFFETKLPSDFYNIERLTIAYGPQSILFGLGTSGGVLDVTTKRALMRDRRELSFQTDNNGSFRSMLDVNQQVVPQRLALRVVGLDSDRNHAIDGGYNDQRRLFGTLTYKPLARTTVRLTAERTRQEASFASNFVSQDYVSPWVAAGRPLFDNSTGHAAVPNNNTHPYLFRNTNALRTVVYGGAAAPATYVWNGSVNTKGPHQVPNTVDTRDQSLTDNSIFPVDFEPRVGGKIARLHGTLVRAAIEQKVTDHLFVELGLNYEKVKERRGGPFFNGESVNLFADANRFLPGGTVAQPRTTPNPNAGGIYIESFPAGQEALDETREARLTVSYELDFARRSDGRARWLGRHRFAGMLSRRRDDTRTQSDRAVILGDTAFTTGDLMNNSRLIRARYYLDPARGSNYAVGLHGGGDPFFGPWTFTDAATGQSFTATMFDHPAGRTSSTGGFRKELSTYTLALQSFFWKDRINVFAGRRVDAFETFSLDVSARTRGDQLAAGDRRGLFPALHGTRFETKPTLDDDLATYSYGGVVHIRPWLSVSGSWSDNTSLPSGFLAPDNSPLDGIISTGHDYGLRFSFRDDAVSLRVNFFEMEQTGQHENDAQGVRNNAARIEQRLRGSDRPAGIVEVPADGFDPVTRGDAYRAVEDKLTKGTDVTLVARLTRHWDLRWTVGQQRTFVSNKSKAFNAWVRNRVPVWTSFGGLGWDNVAISDTDTRSVRQFYEDVIATEMTRFELRNNLRRFRQREWRSSVFTNYRISEGPLRGLNVGGGARWAGKPRTGFVQRVYPDGSRGDDVTKPVYGDDELFFDALLGYGGTTKRIGGHKLDWKVQLNVRNLFNDDDIVGGVSRNDLAYLDWVRVEPRQVVLTTTFTF